MDIRPHALSLAVALSACFLATPAGAAIQPRPGLWDVTVTMQPEGGLPLPDFSSMPADLRAQMEAWGIEPGAGNTLKTRQCLTPEQAAARSPILPDNQNCRVTASQPTAQGFSGDMACTGEFEGTGHFTVTYRSDVQSDGEMTMTGTAQGVPVSMRQNFQGQWAAPDCAAPAP